jgi:G-patch domain
MESALSEKYGKGVKLLKMMGGFEVGKGIGKNNQGIVNPVEAIVKSDNKCLGTGQFAS